MAIHNTSLERRLGADRRDKLAKTSAFLVIGAVFLCLLSAPDSLVAVQKKAEETDDYDSIFVPAPRELTRALSKAQEFSSNGEYAEAVNSLAEIIDSEIKEDYFVRSRGDWEAWTSIWSEVMNVIGQMPKRGRDIYELKFGIQAQQILEAAVRSGDIDKIREISGLYFHTKAGYSASMLLGRYYLDRGEPLSAAFSFKRIYESAEARDMYQPQIHLLLASSWYFAGSPKNAEQVLRELSEQYPDAKVIIDGRQVEMFSDNSRSLEWLKQSIGEKLPQSIEIEQQWVMHRGNPQRLGQSAQGMPLIQPNWLVPVNNDMAAMEVAGNIKEQFLSDHLAATPSVNALAVADFVIMRTPDQLVGVDARSGKRKWVFPWDQDDLIGANDEASVPEVLALANREKMISQRLFQDSVYGQLSSDGRRVFFVDQLGFASDSTYSVPNARGRFANPMAPRETNRLVALELVDDSGGTVDGKLSWWVGDESGWDEPELAGAFFLGPPLPLQNELYVICEINQELRLVVLDGETGRLNWSQQLAAVDLAGKISQDSIRRLAGATPSYADGVLVCPTSTGAVVGIDASTRRLLWGFRYSRTNNKSPSLNSMRKVESREPGQKWADGTIAISAGNVILTPIESDMVYCLDLFTGNSNWKKTVQREGDIYVAGVYDDQLILVGDKRVRAVHLNDGSEAWSAEFAEHGLVSGRGYISDDRLFVPTVQSKLLKIELKQGRVVSSVETSHPLGNLISYNGQIISHGVDWVASYPQDEATRPLVASRLKENPQDPGALLMLAQLQMNDGQYIDAFESLQTAYRSRQRKSTRKLIGRAMVGALRADFAGSIEETSALESELDDPATKNEYLRLKIDGLVKADRPVAAIEALFELVTTPDAGRPEYLLVGENQRSIRWDRWVQTTVEDSIERATPVQVKEIKESIQDRIGRIAESGSIEQLQRIATYLARTELAEQAGVELARRYFLNEDYLSAELLFQQLKDSEIANIAATSHAGLARIFDVGNKIDFALQQYRLVASRYPDSKCWGELTGANLLEQALNDERFKAFAAKPTWPYGQVDATEVAETSRNVAQLYSTKEFKAIERRWPGPLNLQVSGDMQNNVYVRNEMGETLGKISLTEPGKNIRNSFRYYNAPQYMLNGHLMIIIAGYNLVGVDLYRLTQRRDDAVLWRENMAPAGMQNPSNNMISLRRIGRINDWGAYLVADHDSRNNRVGVVAWASQNGLCFLRDDELICIHPRTGELIWQRKDIEQGSDCLADDDFVFVISRDGKLARQFRLFDGQERDSFEMPDYVDRWQKSGSRVLAWSKENENFSLFVYDLNKQEKIWEEEISNKSKAALIGEAKLGILTPENEFFILDLQSGQRIISATLSDAGQVKSLMITEDSERYFVGVNTLDATPYKTEDSGKFKVNSTNAGPLFDGLVFCLDKQTGKKLWPSPAVIDKFGFPMHQPSDVPALAFVRLLMPDRKGKGDVRPRFDLIVVDKRDGRPIFAASKPASSLFSFRVTGLPNDNSIRIDLSRTSHKLRFTDAPIPPTAPAQTGRFSSRLARQIFGSLTNVAYSLVAASSSTLQKALHGNRFLAEFDQRQRWAADWLGEHVKRPSLEPIPLDKE